MAIYKVRYQIKGTGYLQFEANSEEEAEREFYRTLSNEECKSEENSWIDQDAVYNVEWDEEVLDVSEC